MTVKELITELSKFPEDIEVGMKMKTNLKVLLSSYERPMTCCMFPKGSVYGVVREKGEHDKVVIEGD